MSDKNKYIRDENMACSQKNDFEEGSNGQKCQLSERSKRLRFRKAEVVIYMRTVSGICRERKEIVLKWGVNKG